MSRAMRGSSVLAALMITLGASSAFAQVFGTFTWQMQPYCNKVTLTLSSVTGNFTLAGSDDQCGATKKGSATGIGVFNPDGTVGINFTIVASPGGNAVHVSASVSPVNGQGTWSDNAGNSGTFALAGATPGLPVRPDGPVFFRATSHPSTACSNCTVLWSNITDNTGGGAYNAGTGIYTVPTSGWYSIAYSIGWSTGATTAGRVCAYISTPSTSIDTASCAPVVGNSSFVTIGGATTVRLNAGNLISVSANALGGGTPTLLPSGSGLTIFKVR